MLVVNVDKINLFRKAVLFDSFIKHYSNIYYDFKISEENDCLLSKKKDDNTECAIFIGEKPNIKTLTKYFNYKIYVYYISIPNKNDQGFIKEKLSKEYIHEVVEIANNNFSQISDKSILTRVFTENRVINPAEIFYKYYRDNIDEETLDKIKNKGMISFTNPKLFNDPFDCDYTNSITGEGKEKFRVLCLTPNYTNILMWSYYGTNHKGFCLGYNKDFILNELERHYSGICFVGKVAYKKKRPPYKITKTLGMMDEILFLINCLFTKYEEWNHENEYRMAIICPDKASDYFSINTPIMNRICGCESTSCIVPHFKKLGKDNKEYLLK